MLSKTIVHVCPRCGSEKLRKNGHAENGSQRAKCKECARTFVLEPKGPRHSKKFKESVVAAYQERTSIRGITRTFGVFYKTIIKWAGEKNRGPAGVRGHAFAQPGRRRARVG